MESRIFGHITQLVGNVIARDSQGNERELMLGDAIYFGEQVICLDENSEVVVSVEGYDQEINLAGNETKLFDAALRDADFLITDVESDDAEEDESEDEDDIEAPSAGDEDIDDETEGSAQFSDRNANQTDINSGLRDANFSQHQPEVEYQPDGDSDQLRSHGSFAINQTPNTITADNSTFTDPSPDIVKPPTIPDIIKPQPPVVIANPTTPEPDAPPVVPTAPVIINSLPVAVADLAQITEDAQPNVVSGNVFNNDSLEQNEQPQPVTDVNGQGVGTVVTGQFGSIIINSNGSYNYSLNNDDLRVQQLIDGETLSDVFSYTITDSTGDTATATLTVTINGANDGVTLTFGDNDPDSNNATERVDEAGLAAGSNPGGSTSTNSSFSLQAQDGLNHITIAGQQISLSQLEALAQTNVTILTNEGTLTLNGYDIAADGTATVSYQYQLTENVDHTNGPVNDSISITVTDRNNDSTTGNLNIAITDDRPQAVADTNNIQEKSTSIGGNVLSNDILGADSNNSPVSGLVAGTTTNNITDNITGSTPATVSGQYGSLVMNADGSYTYNLNNSNLDVQKLSTNGTLEDTFSYTITDSDGNQSTTTLSITINGVDNPVTLVIADNVGGAGGDQQQVFESGLTISSAPDDNMPAHVTSRLSFETPDAVASITIGNTVITAIQLNALANNTGANITIETDKGVLTFTDASLSALGPNTIHYTYQLNDAQDHSNGNVDDVFNITVTDGDGSTQSGTLTIAIVDDAPITTLDSATITEDHNTVDGNVFTNDQIGADSVTLPITSVSTGLSDSPVGAANIGQALNGNYGSLTLNSDGSYTYSLNNDLPAVQALTPADSLEDTFSYTITDQDGDTATTSLTITINGANDGVELTIIDNDLGANNSTERVYEAGLSNGSNPGNSAATNSSFSLKALDGLDYITIANQQVSLAQLETLAQTNVTLTTSKGALTLNGYDAAADGTITLNYQYQLTGNVTHANDPVNDEISITVTDRNNDSTTGTLTIAITDDAPQATVDTNTIEEKTDNISGNVISNNISNDIVGADSHNSPVSGVKAGTTTNNITDNITGSTPATVNGQYGSLVMNADGSYTYSLDNSNSNVQQLSTNGTLEDTFSYTITDNDGDQSTTTLTITINGVDNPVTLEIDDNLGPIGGDNQQVFERGLATGSAPLGNDKSTVTSSFSFKTPDTLHSITIYQTEITAVQLAALANNDVTKIDISTDKGVLTLSSVSLAALGTNTITYSYQLNDTQDHSNGTVGDAINITVTDGDADGNSSTQSAILTIAIVDDVPIATLDSATITEDHNTVDGNVFTNDQIGADSVTLPITSVSTGLSDSPVGAANIGQALNGNYGSLTLNSDGSYTYSLNNDLPAVQALTPADSLEDTFSYTITDQDGDTATTSLTITINGANDGVELTIIDNDLGANNSTERVYEAGLSNGSNPGNSAATNSSFSLKALDGLDYITIANQQVSLAQLETLAQTNVTLTTSKGALTLNGYDAAADGTITLNYQYQLTGNVTHANDPVNDEISITVTDRNNDSTTGTLTIAITDDAPQATVDTNTIEEKTDNISGNVISNNISNDIVGADSHNSPVSGVKAGTTTNNITDNITGSTPATVNGQYGSLVMNADGSYTYSLDNSNSNVQQLSTNGTLEDTFSYTITDNDGDQSTTTLTITINGVDNPVTLEIDDNLGPIGGDNQQVFESGLANGSAPNDINSNGNSDIVNAQFSFSSPDGLDQISINGTNITQAQLADASNNNIVITTTIGTLTITGATISALGTGLIDYSYQLTAAQDHSSGAITDQFSINITDLDGSTALEQLRIAIVDDSPSANNDALRTVFEGLKTITGNVIDNTVDDSGDDILSADNTTLSSFTYTNDNGDLTAGVLGSLMDTKFGSLTVNGDGSWTYTSDDYRDHTLVSNGNESFKYTLTDQDGDTSTATQEFDIVDGPDFENNPTVILYEGSPKVDFYGSDNYNKSDSTVGLDTTATAADKLQISDAGISSFTFNNITTIIPAGGSNNSGDTDMGNLTVNYNGTWSYTAPANYKHVDANGVNSAETRFSYTIANADGDNVNQGYQTIIIDDTIATLNQPVAVSVEEQYLVTGTDPNAAERTKTGTFDFSRQADTVNVTFDNIQSTFDTLIGQGLSSFSELLSYQVSKDGHTLTAIANGNGNDVFIITITDPIDASAVGYSVEFLRALDHENAVINGNDDIVFDFSLKVTDGDGDIDNNTFSLTVIDDNASSFSVTVDEDSNNIINTHANVTFGNTTLTKPTHGAVTLESDGTISYQPAHDFSGSDSFTYTTTVVGSPPKVTTINVTVTPVADAPINLIDSASLSTEEDTLIPLGLNAPTLTDDDDDTGNSDDMDNSELYGVITLSGIPAGAKLFKSTDPIDPTILTEIYSSTGADITIVLNGGSHIDAVSGMLTMTVAQYESLQLKPPLDSHHNIEIEVSVASYEVDELGVPLVGVDPAVTTETINIDVQAVTDDVKLDSTETAVTLDEDQSIDLAAILTATYGDKIDGSETFSYIISNVPVGSTLTVNGINAIANSDGVATVTFNGAATPTILFKPPENFSGNITGMTITLKAIDIDNDSTDANPLIIEELAQVTLNLHVDPLANDVTLTSASGFEDTNIAFLAGLNDGDDNSDGGTDHITEITIAGIEKDLELTTSGGNSLYTSLADGGSFTIVIGTTNNPQTNDAFTLAEVKGLLLDTHRDHSSLDVKLDITVESTDTNTVLGPTVPSTTNTLYTAANGNPFVIQISPVSEGKTNSNGDANIDIITQGDRGYNSVTEDGIWTNLNDPYNGSALNVTNEDDITNGLAPYQSEKTEINFSNVPVGSMFQYTLGVDNIVLTVENKASGVDIPLDALNTVWFKPAGQYSGDIEIKMAVKTTDYDEDTGIAATPVFSTADTLTLTVVPVADAVTLAVKQAIGDEDAGRSNGNSAVNATADDIDAPINGIDLDITTSSDDKDGSEVFELKIEKIPDDASIYYNGVLFNKDSGAAGDLTAVNDSGVTWTLTVSNFDNAALLKYIPAHNSDSNTTLDISASSQDGSSTNAASKVPLEVIVNAIADNPTGTSVNEYDGAGDAYNASFPEYGRYNLITTEAIVEATVGNIIDLSGIYKNSTAVASYDDGSESLTIVISGLANELDLLGAQYLGGTGTERRWSIAANDINSLQLQMAENFSGDIPLTVTYITTEKSTELNGDSKTHPTENLMLLVKPSVEASVITETTVKEDQLTRVNFDVVHQNGDTDETINRIKINIADLADANLTLYVGQSTSLSLVDAANDSNNKDVKIHFSGEHYELRNGSINDIYVLGDADTAGTYTFEVEYQTLDYVDYDSNILDSANLINQDILGGYTINITAVTDAIAIAEIALDGGTSGDVSGSTVTIDNNTTVAVTLQVSATNDTNDHTPNGADFDGSEVITQFILEGVPQGVTVENALYAGDINNNSNTGLWYLPINQQLDSNGVTHTINFIVNGNTNSFDSSTIKITAYNQDGNLGEFETATYELTLEKSADYSGSHIGGFPADITEFSSPAAPLNMLEDQSITLDQLLIATASQDGNFSITLTNVPPGTQITGGGVQSHESFWIINGTGNSTDIETALQAVTITPPANFNSHNNDSDNFTFNATMTTYDSNSYNTATLTVTQPVFAITDPIVIDVTGDGSTNEDTVQTFSINLSNDADGIHAVLVDDKVYLQMTGAGSTDGTLSLVDNNNYSIEQTNMGIPAQLSAGTYYVVSGSDFNSPFELNFTPAVNHHGAVKIDVFAISQESQTHTLHPTGTLPLKTQLSYEFEVESILDGVKPIVTTVNGAEDINDNRVQLNFSTLAVNSDHPIDDTEIIIATLLNKIPTDFQVFYHDASGYVLGQNNGNNGSGFNQWSVPVSAAVANEVYIQAPKNWAGTLTDLKLTTISQEPNVAGYIANDTLFTLSIEASADEIKLSPTKTFGGEGEDIAINLNAAMTDIDGSETMTLTLEHLGPDATFKANGIVIDQANISYTGDVYTISNIAFEDINNLSFIQQSMPETTINITVNTVDTGGVNNAGNEESSSFKATIGAANLTADNDQLLYNPGSNIDALGGIDTLVLLSSQGINFNGLSDTIANIEQIDLTANGAQQLTNLLLSDVLALTDNDKALTILGDAADSVSLSNATAKNWSKSGTDTIDSKTFDVYTNSGDSTVKVNIQQDIELNIVWQPVLTADDSSTRVTFDE